MVDGDVMVELCLYPKASVTVLYLDLWVPEYMLTGR